MIIRKSPAELEKMRAAGLLVYKILSTVKEMVAEGVTTMDLEIVAEKIINDPDFNFCDVYDLQSMEASYCVFPYFESLLHKMFLT